MADTQTPKATSKRITLKGETKSRVVYMGPRGGSYIKKAGSFVRISKSKSQSQSKSQQGGMDPGKKRERSPGSSGSSPKAPPLYIPNITTPARVTFVGSDGSKGFKTGLVKGTPIAGVQNEKGDPIYDLTKFRKVSFYDNKEKRTVEYNMDRFKSASQKPMPSTKAPRTQSPVHLNDFEKRRY